MFRAVSRRTLTAVARIESQTSHVGFVTDKVLLGQSSLRVLRFSPVIPPMLHAHSLINC